MPSRATLCGGSLMASWPWMRMAPVRLPVSRSEERRVGKECRSRCDWSSDVCSSDLLFRAIADAQPRHLVRRQLDGVLALDADGARALAREQIGRASCRERV